MRASIVAVSLALAAVPATFGLHITRLSWHRPLGSSPSPGSRFRQLVVAHELPPRGSKYRQPDDPIFKTPTQAFRDLSLYVPNGGKGTMKPGTTPENAPLSELRDLPTPHEAPYYQEVPFHIRWPASHPPPTPILQWLEEIGRLMTPEEEEEVDSRFKKASARSKAGSIKAPRFVTPQQVENQLAQGEDLQAAAARKTHQNLDAGSEAALASLGSFIPPPASESEALGMGAGRDDGMDLYAAPGGRGNRKASGHASGSGVLSSSIQDASITGVGAAGSEEPEATPYFDPLAPPTEEDLNAISRQVFAEARRRQRLATPDAFLPMGTKRPRASRRGGASDADAIGHDPAEFSAGGGGGSITYGDGSALGSSFEGSSPDDSHAGRAAVLGPAAAPTPRKAGRPKLVPAFAEEEDLEVPQEPSFDTGADDEEHLLARDAFGDGDGAPDD